MKRYLIAFVILLAIAVPAIHTSDDDGYTWLILIYLNADNNLYSFGLSDLDEMTSAHRDDVHVKVLVLFDGYSIGDSKLYELHPGSYNELNPYRMTSEVNMGDPTTLRQFVMRAMKTYHAQYIFLDIRDHGGARMGASRDDSNNDHLTMSEISSALEGIPLTIVGFDACLMGNIETMSEITQPLLYIGSFNTEPGDGRDYSRLNVLYNAYEDPYTVAKAVVDTYYTYYSTKYYGPTLAVYDLSLLMELVNDINDVASVLLLEAYSLYSKYGSTLGPETLYQEITGAVSGDGTSDIHVGTSSSAWVNFTVYLEAGKVYNFVLDRNDSADLDLYIFRPNTTSLDPYSAYAYAATVDKPEKTTIVPDVSGNWIIAIDHYSAETKPSGYTLDIYKKDVGLLSAVLGARSSDGIAENKDIEGIAKLLLDTPLNVTAEKLLNTLNSFIVYFRGIGVDSKLSISYKVIQGMAYGDYSSLRFASLAPYWAALVKALTYDSAPEALDISPTTDTETINGYESVVSIYVENANDLQLRLYNTRTGSRQIINGSSGLFDLHSVPVDYYMVYLVKLQDGFPVAAYGLGYGLYGGTPIVSFAHSSFGSTGVTEIYGYASPIANIDIYLNGTLVKTVTPEEFMYGVQISGFGDVAASMLNMSAYATITPDNNPPSVSINAGNDSRYAPISYTYGDDVSVKNITMYIDGRPVYDAQNVVLLLTFERNVTIVIYDTAGNMNKASVKLFYNLIEHPLQNKKPQITYEYTLENQTLKMKIVINDDDPQAQLVIYIDGNVKYNMTVMTGFARYISFDLEPGTHNVTILAIDPYGATTAVSFNITVQESTQPNPPPSEGGEETGGETGGEAATAEEETGGINRTLIAAVILIVVIAAIAAMLLLRRKG